MFCIRAEPVGLVEVKIPLTPTYTEAPAVKPIVLIPVILPAIIQLPTELFAIS